MSTEPRVALAHHWLVSRRGGERCLEALAGLVPRPELFTLLHDPQACPAPPEVSAVHTSALQGLPGARRGFRLALPLMPWLFGRFDLDDFDAVVSNDAALAKCVRVPDSVPHVCICYSPVRYAFDLRETYLQQQVPAVLRPLARAMLVRVRAADRAAAARVDAFVACSRHVAERIERAYGRESVVVYPPVDTTWFQPGEPPPPEQLLGREPPWSPDEQPYLLLGQAVAYKRFDLAVEACARLDRPLVVAGGGPLFERLRATAGPRTVFVPNPSDEVVRGLYRWARALLFPGEEDFGLVPVEAMACGTPVVALGIGGATETVVHGSTGILYEGSTVADVERGMLDLEALGFGLDPATAVVQAEGFSLESHLRSMRGVLAAAGVPVKPSQGRRHRAVVAGPP